MGSEILRAAVKSLQDNNFNIIATLHDAITLMCDESELETYLSEVPKLMIQACEKLGYPGMRVGEPDVIRHNDIWDYKGGKQRCLEIMDMVGEIEAENNPSKAA